METAPNMGQEWEDYSLQVRIMLVEGWSQLFVRGKSGCTYLIPITPDKTKILKEVDTGLYDLAREGKYLGYNTWHMVKIICRGDQIKVFIDGELVTEYIDDDPCKSGRIGLETMKETVYYDDILVEEVE